MHLTAETLLYFSQDEKAGGSERKPFSADMVSALDSEMAGHIAHLGISNTTQELIALRPVPKQQSGDFGFSCVPLAKASGSEFVGREPQELAAEIAARLTLQPRKFVKAYEAMGPFVNVTIDYERFGSAVVTEVLEQKDRFGSENIGHGEHYVVDMSSPNIAKPMSVGHLRSTNIGDALARTMDFMGYEVTRDNHLGDWGTQFGYLMYAIDRDDLFAEIEASDDPITALKDIYVNITAEKRENPDVVTGAREWFAKLEQGDVKARALWQKINDWSLQGFQVIYDQLHVDFDVMLGESFYEPFLNDTVEMIRESGIASLSEGALIIDLRNGLNQIIGIYKDEWINVFQQLALNSRAVFSAENPLETLKEINSYPLIEPKNEEEVAALSDVREAIKQTREPYRTKIQTMVKAVLSAVQAEDATQTVNLNQVLADVFGRDVSGLSPLDIKVKPIEVQNAEELEGEDLRVVLVQKADGSSLYVTRDLATAIYRNQEMKAEGQIYVVGGEQQLYFKQLFEILRRLEHPLADKSHHVWFGLVKGASVDPETGETIIAKMSTRAGTTVALQDLLDESRERALKIISESKNNLTDDEKKDVASKVGVAAVKWNDLKGNPRNEIVFDWDQMLNMQGNSAPFVMYTRARALRVLEKAGGYENEHPVIQPTTAIEQEIILKLAQFTSVNRKVVQELNPSALPTYLFELAKLYNSFYDQLPISESRNGLVATASERETRMALTAAVVQTLQNGLQLLNISTPNKM